MRDEIVEEVRKAREDYSRRFNFDLDAICRYLRQKQRAIRRNNIVSLPPRRAKLVTKEPYTKDFHTALSYSRR